MYNGSPDQKFNCEYLVCLICDIMQLSTSKPSKVLWEIELLEYDNMLIILLLYNNKRMLNYKD